MKEWWRLKGKNEELKFEEGRRRVEVVAGFLLRKRGPDLYGVWKDWSFFDRETETGSRVDCYEFVEVDGLGWDGGEGGPGRLLRRREKREVSVPFLPSTSLHQP